MSSPRQQLHELGNRIVRRLADDIVAEIRDNPRTPEEHAQHRGGPHLRDSFHVVANGEGYDIVSTVDYWFYVEHGHRTRPSHHPDRRGGHVQHWVPAQPYLRPAIHIALANLRRSS
jgi:hypothetical protein